MQSITEISQVIKAANQARLAKNPTEIDSKHGLYLISFKNDRDVSVHDRNIKSGSNSQSGKIIVPGHGYTLKFGKYENGLDLRFSQYHKHMHYFDDPKCLIYETVFSSLLDKLFVFQMPFEDERTEFFLGAASFEEVWNRSIEQYLVDNTLLLGKQNTRSEYRNTVDLKSRYLEIEELLTRIAASILDARELFKSKLL